MESNLPYLTEEEKQRCIFILHGLKDNLNAVENELTTRDHPYKSYLTEKLDNVYLDLSIIRHISKAGDEDGKEI